MASMSEAKLGLWTDHSRRFFDQWQVLATDFWAQCMTALIAVCLTLTHPYIFKIAASFLVFVIRGIEGLAAEWRSTGEERAPVPPAPRTSEERTPFNVGKERAYGTFQSKSLDKADSGPSHPSPINSSEVQPPDHVKDLGSPQSSPEHDTEALKLPQPGTADLGKRTSTKSSHTSPDHVKDFGSPQASRQLDTETLELPKRGAAELGKGTSSPKSSHTSRDGLEDQASTSKQIVSPTHSEGQHQKNPPTPLSPTQEEAHSQHPRTSSDLERQSQHDDDAVDILESAGDSREIIWRYVKICIRGSKKQIKSPSTPAIVITTVLFGLFVAQSVAGVFSAKIASDKSGLSSSTYCGIWQFEPKAGGEAVDRADMKNYYEEARASQYARNCYGSPDPTSTLSCRVFYNQSIAFSTSTRQKCPFSSVELCLGGLHSATTFDTGLVDASVIGINAAQTHKFRRITTCSPLNMSEPYIRKGSRDANDTVYRYYYGAKENTDYTFRTSGHPFEWLVPVYSVYTYFSSIYPENDYWHPIDELQRQDGSTLTIMFVSSMHIYHVQRSFDPIFNAQEPRYFEGLRKPFYYNSDPRARAFACVDTSELCSPDEATCWSMTAPVPPDVPSSPAYWLMKWSLENSNTYDSIKWRLGSALLAQESVSQSVSNSLSSDQWQLEASHLFATSLARIQYDAWKIANGEDHDQPDYVEVTPDEAKGRLCEQYKFKTPEYTNINFLAFIGLILLAFIIFVLSWDVSPKGRQRHGDRSPNRLIIDVITRFLVNSTLKLIFGLWDFVSVLHRKALAYIGKGSAESDTHHSHGEQSTGSTINPQG